MALGGIFRRKPALRLASPARGMIRVLIGREFLKIEKESHSELAILWGAYATRYNIISGVFAPNIFGELKIIEEDIRRLEKNLRQPNLKANVEYIISKLDRVEGFLTKHSNLPAVKKIAAHIITQSRYLREQIRNI
ncbi:MAG: hypothetical protein HY438_04265 [DPANN group archaeon]|nr:hypothetical protein [DPANN group archaeon]